MREENKIEILLFFLYLYIKFFKYSATTGSRLAVGSSNNSISGLFINAFAKATLVFCPEESSPVFFQVNHKAQNSRKFLLIYLYILTLYKRT